MVKIGRVAANDYPSDISAGGLKILLMRATDLPVDFLTTDGIISAFKTLIQNGVDSSSWPESHTRLPEEQELARALECKRSVLREALDKLVVEGFVHMQDGLVVRKQKAQNPRGSASAMLSTEDPRLGLTGFECLGTVPSVRRVDGQNPPNFT